MTDTSAHPSLMRYVARRWLFSAVEAVWCALFFLAGQLLRPNLPEIQPSGQDTVLVLAPHPDDETIGCGGAIARHAKAGDKVTICIVTDGANSRGSGRTRPERAARRSNEAVEAVRRLGGAELLQLALPEMEWREAVLIERLTALLTALHPTIIYTTSVVDYHSEHIKVARCLAQAMRMVAANYSCRVRLYEVQVPLTLLLVNRKSDVSALEELKGNSLTAYESQLPSLLWLSRFTRYKRLLYRSTGEVELFCEIKSEAFTKAVMQAPRMSHYVGFKPRPFSDLLPWLSGTRSRLMLRRALKDGNRHID